MENMEMEELKNTYFVLLSEDNRIAKLTVEKQDEEQFEFELPDDFDMLNISDYQIIDNELVYNPMPIPEPEPTQLDKMEDIVTNTALTTEYMACIQEVNAEEL